VTHGREARPIPIPKPGEACILSAGGCTGVAGVGLRGYCGSCYYAYRHGVSTHKIKTWVPGFTRKATKGHWRTGKKGNKTWVNGSPETWIPGFWQLRPAPPVDTEAEFRTDFEHQPRKCKNQDCDNVARGPLCRTCYHREWRKTPEGKAKVQKNEKTRREQKRLYAAARYAKDPEKHKKHVREYKKRQRIKRQQEAAAVMERKAS
jgi:hypothetical protein